MNENKKLFTAKLSAILNLLWGITESSTIAQIAKAYTQYKYTANIKLKQYLEKKLTITLPDSWLHALESHNIFYSYCYGLFKIVPATVLAQGYPVAILMSEELKFRQSGYFQQLSDLHLHQNGWNTDITFLSHRNKNLLFKMKSLINSGYKIIFFIDGNKGIEQSIKNKNLYETSFKQSNILFHQGFAWLNYLFKTDVLHGLIITSQNNNIKCTHLIDKVDPNLQKQTFMTSVMSSVVYNLESLIQINNVDQWDALLSVYKWIKPQDENTHVKHPVSKQFYSSFCIGKNEYYLLDHKTFKVYPTDRETYKRLRFKL